MKPNLSIETLTSALAMLASGSVVIACAGSPPPAPVAAHELAPQTQSPAGHGSCSAAGCGATKKEEAPTTAAAAETPAVAPAEAAPGPAPEAATPSSAAPAKAAAKAPAKKPAAGHSSCGAGTCSAHK